MAIPSLPLQNPCQTVTFLATASLATKQYHFVYQNAVNEVTVAAKAQNVKGYNVFILQNAPAAGEEAECAVLGTGDSYLVVATGAVAIGKTLSCSTAGRALLSTGILYYAKAKDVATTAGDIIVVQTVIGGST